MPEVLHSTNQYRWLRRLALVQSGGRYKIWRDAKGTPTHDGIPVMQQGYVSHETGKLSWVTVPTALETVEDAQAHCDLLNARLDADKKKGGAGA